MERSVGRAKNYDRDEVLRLAMEVFWKQGHEGTSMKDIMLATRLSKFSLYNEFKDKEDIFYESLKLYLNDALGYYDKYLSLSPLGIKNIKFYFESVYFEDEYYGCFYVRTLTDIHATPKRSHELADSFTKTIEGYFMKNIKASIKAKEFSPQGSSTALAQYLTATDLGLAVFGISNKNKKQLRQMVKHILLSLN